MPHSLLETAIIDSFTGDSVEKALPNSISASGHPDGAQTHIGLSCSGLLIGRPHPAVDHIAIRRRYQIVLCAGLQLHLISFISAIT